MIIPRGDFNEIAMKFGVTRQLVSLVLKDTYKPLVKDKTRICEICNSPALPHKRLCNEHYYIKFNCGQCGKENSLEFPRFKARVERKKSDTPLFCDRVCFGRWMGLRVGFGTRPNSIRRLSTKGDFCDKGHKYSIKSYPSHPKPYKVCNICTNERRKEREKVITLQK